MGELTLILGGARSGKSRHAQELASRMAEGAPVTYIATGQAGDDEMRDRIERHRLDRPADWTTIEEPLNAVNALRAVKEGQVVLVDCLTFFVVNHMLRDGDAATCEVDQWDEPGAEAAVTELVNVIKVVPARVIIVSNEVGMGLVPKTPLGRAFRDAAGRANQTIAAAADKVIFMVAGIPMAIK